MLSLVADYSASSSSSLSSGSNGDSDNEDLKKNDVPQNMPTKLPSANMLLSTNSSSSGEVFSNPFLKAELAERDKLEKHVKMVETDDHLVSKNGLKICWNNRKGRCRFGNKCKYAHDSDIQATLEEQKRTRIQENSKAVLELKNNAIGSSCSSSTPEALVHKTKSRKRPHGTGNYSKSNIQNKR